MTNINVHKFNCKIRNMTLTQMIIYLTRLNLNKSELKSFPDNPIKCVHVAQLTASDSVFDKYTDEEPCSVNSIFTSQLELTKENIYLILIKVLTVLTSPLTFMMIIV